MRIKDIAYILEERGHDYFDAYEAVHAFCALNHDGQNSLFYLLLSSSEFCPGPMWRESTVEEENPAYGEVPNAIAECIAKSSES